MSDQQKKQEKAKIEARILKAADKVGHGLRKAVPYIACVGATLFGIRIHNRNKDDSDKA